MTANLPVLAHPIIGSLPSSSLHAWLAYFSMLAHAAQTFDDLYSASRALDDVTDLLVRRDLGLTPERDNDPIRLFEHWES